MIGPRRSATITTSGARSSSTARPSLDQGLLIKTAAIPQQPPRHRAGRVHRCALASAGQVPPEPFNVIRAVVERELGKPLQAVFSEFDETAGGRGVAGAGAPCRPPRWPRRRRQGAVPRHRSPGRHRPEEHRTLRRHPQPPRPHLDFRFIADEMARMIPQELDFVNEGHNSEVIAANFAGVQDIVGSGDLLGVHHPARTHDGVRRRRQGHRR